ncbi:SPla/RYanodine receptor domain-containing protein isoform 2 [Hibiscus syriacus]|uniref:SPla/RYanodine receptor domain-containing protein isoform 2 n=1 Tax=Hibiscus syriacus TaxID=106335 RepID=A0A6A2Y8W7_HIBSY|nr:SPla/RYanodine receptor domain-containing protein isoform 2 [Hibiscus syriacus]
MGRWYRLSSTGFLVVALDKLSVKYTGLSLYGHDVDVVQADNPVPVKRLVHYFEIYVKDAGVKGRTNCYWIHDVCQPPACVKIDFDGAFNPLTGTGACRAFRSLVVEGDSRSVVLRALSSQPKFSLGGVFLAAIRCLGQSNNGNNNSFDSLSQDLGLYFLELARIGSSKAPVEMEEDEEVVPTELNTINSSAGFLVVAPDKLSVKYTAVSLHGHDVGVVQANNPVPVKRLVYYFEIYVKDAGVKGQIAIGFTSEGFKMRRQPGWEVNSCGYHGDDGRLYRGQAKGDAFGPTYTTGDTVGGGINFASQEFFFTKNGAIVGTFSKEKEMNRCLFPTIAVHSQNEDRLLPDSAKLVYSPILGQLEYEAQERLKQQMTIENMPLPPNISYGYLLDDLMFVVKECNKALKKSERVLKHQKRLVRAYLLHYGYEDTLNSFDLASKSTIPPICIAQENGFDDQDIMYALNQRKTVRQLIRNGEIDAAMNRLRDWYPQIVQVGALEEAVKHGRIELAKFLGLPEENLFDALVMDCVALLAYERPQESSFGYLLQESRRDVVADTVNAMILSTNPKMKDVQGCLQSYLERLLRQLTACCLERRLAEGGQGEAFCLSRHLN